MFDPALCGKILGADHEISSDWDCLVALYQKPAGAVAPMLVAAITLKSCPI